MIIDTFPTLHSGLSDLYYKNNPDCGVFYFKRLNVPIEKFCCTPHFFKILQQFPLYQCDRISLMRHHFH